MTEVREKDGPCAGKLKRIYEYLDGALSCQDLTELDEHLAHCEHCTSEYDLERVIRSVVKRSCTEQASDELKAKIRRRIDDIRENEHAV